MAIKVGSEFQVNTFTFGPQSSSSVAFLTNGGFVVTWGSIRDDGSMFGSYDIYGQRYEADGNPVGTEFRINSFTDDIQFFPAVASLTDGGFVVTWQSEAQDKPGFGLYGIYGQRYDANGNPLGAEFRIDSPIFAPTGPSVASLTNGGFVVTWATQNFGSPYVYGQRYDADGNLVDSKFQINTSFPDRGLQDPSVTSLNDGGFVVTWESLDLLISGDIYGQRYDLNGDPLGTEFRINSSIDGDEQEPSVASLANGGFIVTWGSFRDDGSFSDIYGQRYDADGNPIGTEFRVNTYTTNGQRTPAVTSLTDGGFVVTWQSFEQDGSRNGIYGQQYDANGNPVGSEYQINTFTDNDQQFSSVTSLTNGKFVVTWDSENQDGSSLGIYGQIFSQNVPPPTSSVGIFEVEKLARSGFISNFSFTPIEVNGLPLGSLYDETYYLSQNPDVKTAVDNGVFSNGYSHFITFGGLEGRNPSTLYNEDFYLSHNPDVADAVAMGTFPSGSIHYALIGQQEGRSPSELFNEEAYRLANPDVNDAITNGGLKSGFEHYLKFGKNEGRLPDIFLYDESYYLLQNPDVAAAVAADVFEDGFAHYISSGQGEGRNPSSLFDESQYLALNPDVADAVNANLLTGGFEHYILSGRAEGRQVS